MIIKVTSDLSELFDKVEEGKKTFLLIPVTEATTLGEVVKSSKYAYEYTETKPTETKRLANEIIQKSAIKLAERNK